jgi:hypothetical protein
MRRKLNSKKLIFIVLLTALFTVASYFFDQLVIRTEDNLRNSKINFENSIVKISNMTNVKNEIYSLELLATSSAIRLGKLRNYWFKNILLLKHPELSNYYEKEFKSSFNTRFTVESVIKYRILDFFKDIIWTHNSIKKRMKNIYDWQENLFPKYFEKIDGVTYSNYPEVDYKKIFNEIESLLNQKNFWQNYAEIIYDNEKYEEAFNNFDLQNWSDLHKYSYAFINNFEFYVSLFNDDLKYLETNEENEIKIRNSLIEEISSANTKKNYYILISIICQIFSLFTLLVLFRVLIKENKKLI